MYLLSIEFKLLAVVFFVGLYVIDVGTLEIL